MTLLFEWLPVVAFFIAYQKVSLYAATLTLTILSVLQILLYWQQSKPISLLQQMNFGVLILTGGATLLFGNSNFIKIKPTLFYWTMALVCTISQRSTGTNVIQKILGETLQLPKNVWDQLNRYWTIFFISVGLLNLGIAYTVDTDSWVRFKLFGLLAIQVLFVLSQFFYLRPFIQTTMNALTFTDNPTRWIEFALTQALNPAYLEVLDQGVRHKNHLTKGGGHFLVRIASSKFNKIDSLVERHRLVYAALGDKVGKEIHALQIEIQE